MFTNAEKENLIAELSKLYYQNNFGSTGKADLDTLMFSAYYEHCLNAGQACDDYSLSKALGITQSRVRSLKERKQLKYPYKNFLWEAEFAKAVEHAKYDKHDRYIKMVIEDINVMNEVRHAIEQRGWYDECSLNKKLLRIPLDCFAEICLKECDIQNTLSKEAKANIKKLKWKDSDLNEFLANFTVDGFKSFLKSASKEVICAVLPVMRFSGTAKIAFEFLAKIME